MAAAVQFHGVIGQSAGAGEEPVKFCGVRAVSEGPGGKVYAAADDGMLYELRGGKAHGTGKKAPGVALHWDGETMRAMGHNDTWEMDGETLEFRHVAGDGRRRFDAMAVTLAGGSGEWGKRGKFIGWDAKTDAVVVMDGRGKNAREIFRLPKRKEGAAVTGLGLMGGDLLAATYYPDLRIYRFRADGTQVEDKGWPMNRGSGSLRWTGRELLHCGTAGKSTVMQDCANLRTERSFAAGSGCAATGYGAEGDWEYLGTRQGIYCRKKGDGKFRRRIGGMPKLTGLAVDGKRVYFTDGGVMRWAWLDEEGDGEIASGDGQHLRVNGGWTVKITGLRRMGGGTFAVETEKDGWWKFTAHPAGGKEHPRHYWERVEGKPQAEEEDRGELSRLLEGAEAPGGFEAGLATRQGKWIVAEDPARRRLVRFKIKSEKGERR